MTITKKHISKKNLLFSQVTLFAKEKTTTSEYSWSGLVYVDCTNSTPGKRPGKSNNIGIYGDSELIQHFCFSTVQLFQLIDKLSPQFTACL